MIYHLHRISDASNSAVLCHALQSAQENYGTPCQLWHHYVPGWNLLPLKTDSSPLLSICISSTTLKELSVPLAFLSTVRY